MRLVFDNTKRRNVGRSRINQNNDINNNIYFLVKNLIASSKRKRIWIFIIIIGTLGTCMNHFILFPSDSVQVNRDEVPQSHSFSHFRSIQGFTETSDAHGDGVFHKLISNGDDNEGENMKWEFKSFDTKLDADENDHTCTWATFKSTSGKTSMICIHSFPDVISHKISVDHRWPDCDYLPVLWNEYTSNDLGKEDNLYIDIGANIGSCIMEMLLSTDANIIGFEPHPSNHLNMRKTFSRLDKSLQDRILLAPIAIGNEHLLSSLHTSATNMGNSVIGKAVKDFESDNEDIQDSIQIERLDDVLNTSVNIKLVKLDAQGYECNVLQGMGKLAKQIQIIYFEYAKRWLDAQKCYNLLPSMREIGFKMFDKENNIVLQDSISGVVELVAKKA